MKRFRGTLIAVGVLLVVVLAVWLVEARFGAEEVVDEIQPELFRFEKDDLDYVKVERPDLTLELKREEGVWSVTGQPWRPSRSMIRRVAHQLHDLNARAKVVSSPDSYEVYGLGSKAITVTVGLEGGEQIKFEAGDPNPSSVSYYLRPLPGAAVYVVKKSAVDFYRLDLEHFREHRFASLDADEADTIKATVDGRTMAFHRTGPKRWVMDEPEKWDASREQVRTMLGRTGALKASSYLADQPESLSEWGLAEPRATIRIGMSTGEVITLHVGDEAPETDPLECYVYRVEDDAVYQARCGFLEAYQEDLVDYRNRDILHLHEWDLASLIATRGDEAIRVTRTAEAWRWPDESEVPGSTPRRLAGRAAEFEALAFHDQAPPLSQTGLDDPYAVLLLEVSEDGSKHTVILGKGYDLPLEDEEQSTEPRVYATVDDDPVVYELHGGITDTVDDLFREYGRKLERDAEKGLDGLAPEPEPAPPVERPPLFDKLENP